jgi:hypothetical protein
MNKQSRPIPIYTTSGDLGAFLEYPHIFNPMGEWIGWITPDRQVYSVYGKYVGWIDVGPRIFRKRVYDFTIPDRQPPSLPKRLRIPATVPLAPLMSEITYSTIDVLDENAELLPTLDDFSFVDDMD